jgi:hypothetical protein
MRRKVNLNGSSRESLIEQQRAVMEAVDTLVEKMALATPHGRDYQLNEEGDYDRDRIEWREKIHEALAIKTYAFDTAMNLVESEPGYFS